VAVRVRQRTRGFANFSGTHIEWGLSDGVQTMRVSGFGAAHPVTTFFGKQRNVKYTYVRSTSNVQRALYLSTTAAAIT